MAKQDSLRKSQVARHGAHALTPGLNHVPTVCRSVLDDESFADLDAGTDQSLAPVGQDLATPWDLALKGLADELDEPLPVPVLEEETRIVARPALMQPLTAPTPVITRALETRKKAALDPMAMLEAATIRNVPRRRS